MADLESFALDLEEATAEAIATAPPAPDGAKGKREKARDASANGSGALAADPT